MVGKRNIELKIVAGDHNARKKDPEEQHLNVCSITRHPGYRSGANTRHDIALLRLCNDINVTKSVKPIKLAHTTFSMPTTSDVTVAGWGITRENGIPSSVMKKVTVKTISQSSCRRAYKWISNGQICAGIEQYGGKDSCQGDSGGAMWHQDALGNTYQVGIVSSGRGCARPNYPGIYTNVGFYKTWIDSQITEDLLPDDSMYSSTLEDILDHEEDDYYTNENPSDTPIVFPTEPSNLIESISCLLFPIFACRGTRRPDMSSRELMSQDLNLTSPIINIPPLELPEIIIPPLELPDINLPPIEFPEVNIPINIDIASPAIDLPDIPEGGIVCLISSLLCPPVTNDQRKSFKKSLSHLKFIDQLAKRRFNRKILNDMVNRD